MAAIVIIMALSFLASAGPAPGTYALVSDPTGGIVRMDTRTGEASRCRMVDSSLRCEALAKQTEAR